MTTQESIRAHLDQDYGKPIRDPLWKHIYLSEGLLALINTPPLQQLSRIKQLGPAYQVYPGATHTRLAHSLGVFAIAKRIVAALLRYPDSFPADLEGVKAFLSAALLHDLGHFPYAHSLKELPLAEHEALGAEMIMETPLADIIKEQVGTDPRAVAAIIDPDQDSMHDPQIVFFRRILSGPLDPDKLDYLNRDAYFCGVPYGVQDIDFILSRIRPHRDMGLALHSSGISAIENLLFSKYLMYRAVYWHRTVRVATAMIKKALYPALAQNAVTPSDLYHLDDELFFQKFTARTYPSFELIERVAARNHYRVLHDEAFPADGVDTNLSSDLELRTQAEALLAETITPPGASPIPPEAVIIDVPEAVSFEVQLPVLHDGEVVAYPQSDTVFTPQVVADFTRTLRRLRVIVDPAYDVQPGRVAAALREIGPRLRAVGA